MRRPEELTNADLKYMNPKDIIAIPENFTGNVLVSYNSKEINYTFENNCLTCITYADENGLD